MIHIYYGFGKGKTSTVNGSVLRAKGAGLKPIIFRFLKGRPTSENKIIRSLDIPIYSNHPSTKFVIEMDDDEKSLCNKKALEQLELVLIKSKDYNFVVLDEVIDLIHVKFITEEKLAAILKQIPTNIEVLITGHYKFDKLFNIADLITYYDPQKHYFKKRSAKKGIEY